LEEESGLIIIPETELLCLKTSFYRLKLWIMFIYNVTVNIADDVHSDWLKWMKEVHMPDVMQTGCFIDSGILKVLYVEDEGHTYSIQYKFLEMADIEKYQKEFAPALQAEHSKKFKDKYTAFRTLLQVID
jgi:hypothetical protein